MAKRMRLPNGFGQITKINNRNLRNPWRAMVTVGHREDGKPIVKMLKPQAYFKSYNDAYMALVEYNRSPYDPELDWTVKELYDRWSAEHFIGMSESGKKTIETAFAYTHSIHDMRVADLRAYHIREVMNTGNITIGGKVRPISNGYKVKVKSVYNMLLDYAVEHEVAEKNVARSFAIPNDVKVINKTNRKEHIAFTSEEITKLWENITTPYVDVVLIQCFTGFRPGEICDLKLENVDLENGFIRGGKKTVAGIDRVVPIHSAILPIVAEKYNKSKSKGSEYLLWCDDANCPLDYSRYKYRFRAVMNNLELNPEHMPHDPRKTFVTAAKADGVDEYAIKRIVGHSIKDITENVYTSRSKDWLKDEIEKIKSICR